MQRLLSRPILFLRLLLLLLLIAPTAAAAAAAAAFVFASPLRPRHRVQECRSLIRKNHPTSTSRTAASTAAAAAATSGASNNDEEDEEQENRWSDSGRWEKSTSAAASGDVTNEKFLLQEKYGTYFRLPNPHTLMTKIICTIGPATSNPAVIGRLMDAGMSAARINMSHGDHERSGAMIDVVRSVAQARQQFCPIILDTKGPEIRITWISTSDDEASLNLESGDAFILYTGQYTQEQENGTSPGINTKAATGAIVAGAVVSYPYLTRAVHKGDVILLNDGRISLIVTDVPNEDEVRTQVIEGGELVVNKGVNLPGCAVELPHLTDKDVQDILFGVTKEVEYIAHSFTRSAAGINRVRELPGVVETGCHIIAKIESQEGLDHFNSILAVSDGIMVARGDLGVEIPLERVCSVQKRLVAACNAAGKPVVVATELLDSMISHPRPTRAEASDVANAVFDGADCVMLSGESAVGKYPVQAVQVMTHICKEAELDVASSLRAASAATEGGSATGTSMMTKDLILHAPQWVSSGIVPSTISRRTNNIGGGSISSVNTLRDSFAKSAIVAAKETGADLIIAITRTGLTANALAKFFSSVPVMVLTMSPRVCNQVILHRSVKPYLVHSLQREGCIPRAVHKAVEWGLVRPGSRVLLLTGKDDLTANRLETFIVGE